MNPNNKNENTAEKICNKKVDRILKIIGKLEVNCYGE